MKCLNLKASLFMREPNGVGPRWRGGWSQSQTHYPPSLRTRENYRLLRDWVQLSSRSTNTVELDRSFSRGQGGGPIGAVDQDGVPYLIRSISKSPRFVQGHHSITFFSFFFFLFFIFVQLCCDMCPFLIIFNYYSFFLKKEERGEESQISATRPGM